jgi:hypothetical protein
LPGCTDSGRKVYTGEQHVRTLSEHVGLGIMGLGGLVAAVGGVWFLVLLAAHCAPFAFRPATLPCAPMNNETKAIPCSSA